VCGAQRSRIQFEDEDHAVYMSFRWVTTTCLRWEPQPVTLWLYPVVLLHVKFCIFRAIPAGHRSMFHIQMPTGVRMINNKNEKKSFGPADSEIRRISENVRWHLYFLPVAINVHIYFIISLVPSALPTRGGQVSIGRRAELTACHNHLGPRQSGFRHRRPHINPDSPFNIQTSLVSR